MKAVYSLWSKPCGDLRHAATNWLSPQMHLNSWIISVNKSLELFDKVELVTDDQGYSILVEQLKLPFTKVSLGLNSLDNYDKDFWALGKIKAYQEQNEPFIHLDDDAILMKHLPNWYYESPIFAQNPEGDEWFTSAYGGEIDHINANFSYKPISWGYANYAPCMGIFGGSDIDLIQFYCDEVFKFMDNGQWETISNKGSYCIIFEQYLAACCVEYQRKQFTWLTYPSIDKQQMEDMGYIHIWGAKIENKMELALATIAEKEYNDYYTRMKNLFS